ncbi:hypothetical protein SCZ71_15340 [Legionella pneumophila serogroup 1]|uniref:hypothetical protein n=1 Tax=Legionella pneumophila TaxID=446 RepID=UPI00058BB581|nr:hypothetical protein [Legionella pneumophila]HAT9013815.1 hypothetical protein [Legionella pneumophila subsp. pneumophila]MCO1451656.1 hypothetical protein [Legionella pneumophila]MCZ4722956.1 hypothetical protein [Legionella pneumophila]MCZ4729792.1 hypothetical protein [Legionella pneumophila]MCZ4734886.1 hypothetical protein [Legionella pneumophila]
MEIESPQSLFDSAKDASELISLTEFFLAILNIFCRDQNLSEANFGAILDRNKQLTQHLAEVVIKALKEHQSVEEPLLKATCEKKRFFGISNWLDDSSLAKFKRDFIKLYNQIQGSPQFDQFMLLSETKKGDFFVHHGSISMLFTRLLQTDDFAERLDDEQKAFITTAEANFDGVARDGNILPDTHAHIHAAIQGTNLDISQFSHAALRDLYEEICCYTDPAIKQEALCQLQAGRPDFHPELDFAAFLKHVAYGQQRQAEQMLQKYQNFTQQLLRLDTIPFIDRAGRTFTCTAYEYAMRVKDGHMLRMLERYIVQDIETTRIIYERAQDVLYPELRYNSTFFGRLRNDAWHYTTCDNGVVKDHYEQFVGIAPLVSALEQLTYKVREMDASSAAYTPADRAELTHIWVVGVGGAQRMLPEHMIQEYSQFGSERAFEQLLKNPQLLDSAHPKNLKRRLREDEKTLWFSEALGSEYAIARGRINFPYSIDSAPDILGKAWGTSSEQELEAIRLIDTIRTKDVYDSFNRLAELLPTNHEIACMRAAVLGTVCATGLKCYSLNRLHRRGI